MENDEHEINKMKDFLMIYNKMAEVCFNQCIENFSNRHLTSNEELCIEKCSSKGVAVNHKLMISYIDIQPEIINKRTQELEKQQRSISATGTVES